MRIALFNALYPTPLQPKIFGGAEVLVRQIAERLAAQGDEVVAVRIALDGRRRTEEANGVRVEFVPLRNLFTPFGPKHNALAHLAWHVVDDWFVAHPEIAVILDEFRPQIVHSHTLNGLNAYLWQLARDRGIPVVHTLHDYYLVCPRCSRFKGETSCTKTCGSCAALTMGRRRRSALVNAVVGVSQRTLDIHVNEGLFATAARHVIRNVPNPDIGLAPLDLPGRPLHVGYLGRFSPEKGVRLLAEAAGRLEPGTVKLVLAGHVSDEERAVLAALAPQTELDFVGFVAPNDFYAKVDVAAVPSIWEEPGALVLLDALAAGRPVLATAFGGLPEMFEDGVTGWTVAPDAESLATAIRRLVAAPALVLDAHERLKGRRSRTLDDVVTGYSDIYRGLAQGTA
ncbi:glycosyltransferase family 4 protein [Xanthobacter autotrophicus]|uniref:glycosyltransferase family 4 protein n=1 Tax=Xanthobacter TaxID=279 RepID=UPI0024AC39CF|nr:glycosyltransferase family 4 protein [Xanthobacter autotrophicus]MDI4665572.1 glycosyltransferase family 4 protein [Xanthobacter autotrophicus]